MHNNVPTSLQSLFHTCHIDGCNAGGKRDDGDVDDDSPVEDQGSNSFDQASEES